MNTPRLLLLTSYAPDMRYAGGEAIRKLVGRFPADRIRWASLHARRDASALPFEHRSFVPRQLHWRLRRTVWNAFHTDEWQAARLARDIAAWLGGDRPEVLWVVPELGAVNVAYHLAAALNLPVHATIHDAWETARFIVPPLYYPVYAARMNRLLAASASVDAISKELLARLRTRFPHLSEADGMVLPPSIPRANMVPDAGPMALPATGSRRRIGFCGSMRVSAVQWQAFLALLGRLPYEFEIVSYAYDGLSHDVPRPGNVAIAARPFAETESTLIRELGSAGLHGCYLGLWKEPARRLFGQTSLSAKLASYAAAGCPIIVDGPADSAAWLLVRQYGAGVLCGEDEEPSRLALDRLFGDETTRLSLAAGAARMCREEFELERNVERFRELLGRTARGQCTEAP